MKPLNDGLTGLLIEGDVSPSRKRGLLMYVMVASTREILAMSLCNVTSVSLVPALLHIITLLVTIYQQRIL